MSTTTKTRRLAGLYERGKPQGHEETCRCDGCDTFNRSVTVSIRVVPGNKASSTAPFVGVVYVGNMPYAWAEALTKAEARREAKRAAEEMGLVSRIADSELRAALTTSQAEVERLKGGVASANRAVGEAYFNGGKAEMKRHFSEGGCRNAIAAVEAQRDRALAAERQARELLERWRQFANERWHDHATTKLVADTLAFLAPAPGTPGPATTPDTGEGTR